MALLQALLALISKSAGKILNALFDFDDWQVLYRQILQVGRAIHVQRQLMDLEAAKAQRGKGRPSGLLAPLARATG
jgi:hypothetical protein